VDQGAPQPRRPRHQEGGGGRKKLREALADQVRHGPHLHVYKAYRERDEEHYRAQRDEILSGPPGPDRDDALADLDEWLESRPETAIFREWRRPYTSLQDVWDGFWDLDGDRSQSFIASAAGTIPVRGAIPYVSRAKWLDDHGYEGERREWVLRLWRFMDAELSRLRREQDEADGDDESDD
jgi:hypothetical protein